MDVITYLFETWIQLIYYDYEEEMRKVLDVRSPFL